MPDKKLKRAMFRQMLLIRRFEEKVKQLYRAGEITGAIHLYIGQEAVAVGATTALDAHDYTTSGHRSHGHSLAKGLDVKHVMAEMMGRVTGVSKGRGGSMHLFDRGKCFLGGNGLVGGGIPIATGAAFSAKVRKSGQVALCFFSDGAANQGVVHECMNVAALWRLPVIYLCENNRLAATTPVTKSTATADIAPRAEAYGIPWAICDGNDVLDVHRAVRKAAGRARAGKGATLIEAKTYRVEPHCGIIPDMRPRSEVDQWRADQNDPISRFETRLLRGRSFTAAELKAVRRAVERTLADAIEFARGSPFPAAATAVDFVYAE